MRLKYSRRETKFSPSDIESEKMTRKKNREPEDDGKIPVGLSSRDFLKYYETHKTAFNAETARKSRRKSASNGRAPSQTEPKGSQPVERKDEIRPKNGDMGKKKRGDVGSEPGNRGKSVGLRVIGGKFKAVHLEYGGDHRVRPMKDRIRESVFNLIGTLTAGRHVIDLFAGTGALAFEALSRGAASATLIEVHFPTARIARRNIAALEEKEKGIADRIDLTATDVFFWGKGLAETLAVRDGTITHGTQLSSFDDRFIRLPQDVPWLVFCSPPYDFYVNREGEMLELIETLKRAAPPESLFVIEADGRFDFDRLNVEIAPKKRRSYPPAEIGIFMT